MEIVWECWNYKNTLVVMGIVSWASGSNIWPSVSILDDPYGILIFLIYLLLIKMFVDTDIFYKTCRELQCLPSLTKQLPYFV